MTHERRGCAGGDLAYGNNRGLFVGTRDMSETASPRYEYNAKTGFFVDNDGDYEDRLNEELTELAVVDILNTQDTEIEELTEMVTLHTRRWIAANNRAIALESALEAERARAEHAQFWANRAEENDAAKALERYGVHEDGCRAKTPIDPELLRKQRTPEESAEFMAWLDTFACDCGLDAALDALRSSEKGEAGLVNP